MVAGPSLAETLEATAEVRVKTKRGSGAAWDAFGGAPDLRICVVTDFGTKCADTLCRDSFECSVPGLKVPDEGYRLRVIDVDTEQHDLIGEVACTGLGACEPSGQVESILVRSPSPKSMAVGGGIALVQGCSCTFTAPEREPRIPIFSSNIDWSEARMRINGNTVNIGYQAGTDSPKEFLGPNGIKVSLQVEKTGEGMESTLLEGTVTVEGELLPTTLAISGLCGC